MQDIFIIRNALMTPGEVGDLFLTSRIAVDYYVSYKKSISKGYIVLLFFSLYINAD